METCQEKVKIINKLGMHARAAAVFVQTANKFDNCEIFVSKDSNTVNGKSIMGLMMLAAAQGSEILIQVKGRDCQQALESLKQLINDRFGEDE